MLIDLSRRPTPPRQTATGPPVDAVVRHREHVVRRLLDRGLSPATLLTVLPDFRPLIERLSRVGTDATPGR